MSSVIEYTSTMALVVRVLSIRAAWERLRQQEETKALF
jgi:hypothetical protein